MRYLKMLGLSAVMAVALMAVAGGASATTITSPTGTTATPTIKAESEGHLRLVTPVTATECRSAFEGTVESHGVGVTAKVPLTTLTFTSCTNSWHFTTVTPGQLTIHWTSGYHGTVTSTGMRVDATRFGVTCVYETQETHLGTITGGKPATLHITASIPINTAESSAACGSGNSPLTGSYELTSPESLYVDEGSPPPPGTTITFPTGTVATPTIKAESEGGHLVLQNPIANINCGSTLEGKVESHGAESPAKGKLSSLAFTGCTNSWHVTAVTLGELAIDWTSGYDGTVTSIGAKIDATRFGVTCAYETGNTKIGTITGGSPATLHINGSIPVNTSESGALCGSSAAKLEASYKLTSPESLYVDKGVPAPPGTTITSPTGTAATPTVKAESEGHVDIDNEGGAISCASILEGNVESHGAESSAKGKVSSLTFTGCTNSWHVTTVTAGELAIDWTSGYDGTIISTGTKIDATRFGVTCVYETNETELGTITGGTPATVEFQGSIPINVGESSAVCGSGSSALTGSYKFTSPGSLFVDG